MIHVLIHFYIMDVCLNQNNVSLTDCLTEERVDQAGPSSDSALTQAQPLAAEESGLFIFPIARTVMFAWGALRTDRTEMKKQRPLRLRMLWRPDELWGTAQFWNRREKWHFIPHSLWQRFTANEVSCIYFSIHVRNSFSLLAQIKVIYFWNISECWMGLVSAHCEFCKYLAISWIKKMESIIVFHYRAQLKLY